MTSIPPKKEAARRGLGGGTAKTPVPVAEVHFPDISEDAAMEWRGPLAWEKRCG